MPHLPLIRDDERGRRVPDGALSPILNSEQIK